MDANSVLKYMHVKHNLVASHTVLDPKHATKFNPGPKPTKTKYLSTLVKAKQNYDTIQGSTRQNTPKASKTTDSNCLNFKLVVPPHN